MLRINSMPLLDSIAKGEPWSFSNKYDETDSIRGRVPVKVLTTGQLEEPP